MKRGAVILAAGRGMRLGGVAKALLPAGNGRTFLSKILATARAAGLDHPIVVVGPPFGDEVGKHAEELGAVVVDNPEPERGMASSVALGFHAIAGTSCDAAWLWPVDHPDVTEATLHALIKALGDHDAARPVVGGRGGHPPLISRALWPQLAQCGDAPAGARSVLVEADVLDLDVPDEGCVRDVDTAYDVEKV
jgi:CTP:molybdopterin cytidylyltransferase MocA